MRGLTQDVQWIHRRRRATAWAVTPPWDADAGAAFCAGRDVQPAHADTSLVVAFRDQLAVDGAAGTVRFDLAAVTSFFRWLSHIGVREDNPAVAIERPPRQDKHTHNLEASAAVAVVEAARGGGYRPLALCCLFLLYGLPTSAVAQLDVGDVRATGLAGPQLRARLHGGRRELLALTDPAHDALVGQAGRVAAGGPLFPGAGHQGRSGRHTLSEEVVRAASGTVVGARVTPKVLRATHQAAVRACLAHLFTSAFGEPRLSRPPDDLAAAVWTYLSRCADG